MSTQSQKEQILAYLRGGVTLTSLEALDLFQCARLASRICDIKKELPKTEVIETIPVSCNGKRFASYKLVKAA